MKRCFALLLALLLAALPALADEQLDADRQLVEALFAAAAGTTADAEKTAMMFDLFQGDDLQGRKDYISDKGHEYLELADIS